MTLLWDIYQEWDEVWLREVQDLTRQLPTVTTTWSALFFRLVAAAATTAPTSQSSERNHLFLSFLDLPRENGITEE